MAKASAGRQKKRRWNRLSSPKRENSIEVSVPETTETAHQHASSSMVPPKMDAVGNGHDLSSGLNAHECAFDKEACLSHRSKENTIEGNVRELDECSNRGKPLRPSVLPPTLPVLNN